MSKNYDIIKAETYSYGGEIHMRPVAGEIYETTMNISCSKTLRNSEPVGTKFNIPVRLVVKDDQSVESYLYCHHSWEVEAL